MSFDATNPQARQAVSDALGIFRNGLLKVQQALANSERSSARWAQSGRKRAGGLHESLEAAQSVTECSLDNLSDFSSINHAFFKAGELFLQGDDSFMHTQAILDEIIKAQAKSSKTRDKTNALLQKPEALGINARSIAKGDPFGILDEEHNDPYKSVVIAAAVGIETSYADDAARPSATPAA